MHLVRPSKTTPKLPISGAIALLSESAAPRCSGRQAHGRPGRWHSRGVRSAPLCRPPRRSPAKSPAKSPARPPMVNALGCDVTGRVGTAWRRSRGSSNQKRERQLGSARPVTRHREKNVTAEEERTRSTTRTGNTAVSARGPRFDTRSGPRRRP